MFHLFSCSLGVWLEGVDYIKLMGKGHLCQDGLHQSLVAKSLSQPVL